MIQPPFLQKGDSIGIVAPGRKLSRDIIEASVKRFKAGGMHVLLGAHIFSNAHSYLSGTDEERLNDFQKMLDDPSIRAIICARGGYGASRIIDQLNFNRFLDNPKWVCGFSDVTALHLTLQKNGVQSIHSTMPVLFTKTESVSSIDSLFEILEGNKNPIGSSLSINNKPGEASGQLIGGNLSLIIDSLGTQSEIDTRNKILVIEEIDEYLYRIDRMMTHLKRANKLSQLAGLVVGYFSDLKEGELPFNEHFEEIILNHVKEFEYPVGFNFPIGHENPNLPWIEGAQAKLIVSADRCILQF